MRWREGCDKACGEMSQLFEIGIEPQLWLPHQNRSGPRPAGGNDRKPDTPEPSPVGPFDLDGGMLRPLLPVNLNTRGFTFSSIIRNQFDQ